jgi:hypothetical protein
MVIIVYYGNNRAGKNGYDALRKQPERVKGKPG